jgi:hypothetical protein
VGRPADEVLPFLAGLLEALVEAEAACGALVLQCAFQLETDVLHADRFLEVMVGAVAHGGDGAVDGAERREDDDDAVVPVGAELADEVDAVLAPEHDVGEDEVEILLVEEIACVADAGGLGEEVAGLGQRADEGQAQVLFVLDDQYACQAGCLLLPRINARSSRPRLRVSAAGPGYEPRMSRRRRRPRRSDRRG